MLRLTGAPPSKPDKQFPFGQDGPMWFTEGERKTALAMAEDYAARGHHIRVCKYSLDKGFGCIFDSRSRKGKATKARKAA